MNLAVFLKDLRSICKQKDVAINGKTCDLLLETVSCIETLIGNVKLQDTPSDENEVDFIFDLNEQHFKIRTYILCRLCPVSRILLIQMKISTI